MNHIVSLGFIGIKTSQIGANVEFSLDLLIGVEISYKKHHVYLCDFTDYPENGQR